MRRQIRFYARRCGFVVLIYEIKCSKTYKVEKNWYALLFHIVSMVAEALVSSVNQFIETDMEEIRILVAEQLIMFDVFSTSGITNTVSNIWHQTLLSPETDKWR